jgi:hypothetical protein
MKTIKAKYYEESKQIIPLDPQPVRVQGQWMYERTGTDELGEFCIIDFIVEGDTYFDYDAATQKTHQPLEVKITEEEWNQEPKSNTETINTQKFLDVLDAKEPTSQELPTTNTEMNQLISLMVTEKPTLTIRQRFSNVLHAISLLFRK